MIYYFTKFFLTHLFISFFVGQQNRRCSLPLQRLTKSLSKAATFILGDSAQFILLRFEHLFTSSRVLEWNAFNKFQAMKVWSRKWSHAVTLCLTIHDALYEALRLLESEFNSWMMSHGRKIQYPWSYWNHSVRFFHIPSIYYSFWLLFLVKVSRYELNDMN